MSNKYQVIFNGISACIQEYVEAHKLKTLVLGVSGGVDSAVVAAIAANSVAVLKKDKDIDCKLIGRYIHIDSNKPDERARAELIGKAFCDDFEVIDLTHGFDHLRMNMEMTVDGKEATRVALGNIKARMRMIQLYHIAGMTGGIVLGTENKTENLLGFFTLHGDNGTDFEPITSLWKTEVYGLAQWIADATKDFRNKIPSPRLLPSDMWDKAAAGIEGLEACIVANPTDGLGVSNSDLDQLDKSSYAEVDNALQMMEDDMEYGAIDENCPIYKRYMATMFKREGTICVDRWDILNRQETNDE